MRPTIEQIRSVLPVSSSIKWNLVGINISASAPISLPDGDALNIRCISTTLPKLTETPTEIMIRGHKVRQPGIYDYEKIITLIMMETVDNTISLFWRDWRNLCWEPDTGASLPKSDLEATILIQRLDPQDEPIYQYELFGCYPSDSDLGILDGVTPEVVQPNLIINYDYFREGPVS